MSSVSSQFTNQREERIASVHYTSDKERRGNSTFGEQYFCAFCPLRQFARYHKIFDRTERSSPKSCASPPPGAGAELCRCSINRIVAEGDASAGEAAAMKKAAKKTKPNERTMENAIWTLFRPLSE